jgi:excisionase family DNA binding protein
MNLLTLRDVAGTLKVSETTVRRMVRDGSLAAYKVGRRGQLRIREEDLESFLETQRVLHGTEHTEQEEPDDAAQ